MQLLGLVPTDPGILQKVGTIFDNEGDKQQAYTYHFDSYKNFPSNLEVIDWLGSYFIELQVAEKAIVYFERAALMQPDEVKWQLMIASCYRYRNQSTITIVTRFYVYIRHTTLSIMYIYLGGFSNYRSPFSVKKLKRLLFV